MTEIERARVLGRAFMLGRAFAAGIAYVKTLTEDEAKWITVKPNGANAKGRPALIDSETGRVLGGMGGKRNGQNIKTVRKTQASTNEESQTTPESQTDKPDTPDNTQKQDKKVSLLSSYLDFFPEMKENFDFIKDNNSALAQKVQTDFDEIMGEIDNRTDVKAEITSAIQEEMREGIEKYREAVDKTLSSDAETKHFGEMQIKAYDLKTSHFKNILDGKIDPVKDQKPAQLGSVKCGQEMDFNQANELKANPNFGQGEEFLNNCQTCVIANEARRRGFDVSAIGNTFENLCDVIGCDTTVAWYDPDTLMPPEKENIPSNITTVQDAIDYFTKTLKQDERYHLELDWLEEGAHIVTMFKENDDFKIYDPQSGILYTSKNGDDLNKNTTSEFLSFAKVQSMDYYRVDNLCFNTMVCNEVLKKQG